MESVKTINENNQCEKRNGNEEEIESTDAVDESTKCGTDIVTASSDDIDLTTSMFSILTIDCLFDHLFPLLPLRQLLVFRLTCKRMNLAVNHYIKKTYSNLQQLRVNEQKRWIEFCQTSSIRFKWEEIKRVEYS